MGMFLARATGRSAGASLGGVWQAARAYIQGRQARLFERERRVTLLTVPQGSYLIVSAGHLDGHTGRQFTAEYQAEHLHHHTREDIAGFLGGLELIKPGITEARAWRVPVLLTRQPPQAHIWAAVARKPEPRSRPQ